MEHRAIYLIYKYMKRAALTTIFMAALIAVLMPVKVSAQVCNQCPGDVEPEVNFTCQRAKIIDPDSSYAKSCDLCICPGDNPDNNPGDAETINLNIFGINFRLNSTKAVSQLIYLGFLFFLGVIALATIALGIYGAVKRSQSEDEENIAAAQKIITNAVVGFALVIIGILGAQLVATFLGVGTLNEIVDLNVIFGD